MLLFATTFVSAFHVEAQCVRIERVLSAGFDRSGRRGVMLQSSHCASSFSTTSDVETVSTLHGRLLLPGSLDIRHQPKLLRCRER
jgi:hypothetical protein